MNKTIVTLSLFFICVPIVHQAQTLIVLGTAQDGGQPHLGCTKVCCKNITTPHFVSSLGVVQKDSFYLFDATPNIVGQITLLNKAFQKPKQLAGIFLTHAHIGHYTGLMYLGREALNAKNTPVYCMPRLENFIINNGPWSQLVRLNNISIKSLQQNQIILLNNNLKIIPILVPHRDEYAETVGYKIIGASKTALYIPDIDKWKLWNKNIVDEVDKVDYAFIDGTFFEEGEINRPMAEVPHPFISETVILFKNQAKLVKNKIYFIHFNHTNPATQVNHKKRQFLEKEGFHFARQGMKFEL